MPGGFIVDLSQIDALRARLLAKTGAMDGQISQELQASALNIDKEAKETVPVDTGALRQSISWDQIDNSHVEIVAQKDYAPYVEFGTGGMVDVPAGLEDYAMQFKGEGKRKVNLPARPFLFPALMDEKPNLIERLKNVLLQ